MWRAAREQHDGEDVFQMREAKEGAGERILDPICDMIVDVAEARDRGLTLELDGIEYAFCGPGCQVKFAKAPQLYRSKVAAWLAAR